MYNTYGTTCVSTDFFSSLHEIYFGLDLYLLRNINTSSKKRSPDKETTMLQRNSNMGESEIEAEIDENRKKSESE